MNNIEVFKEESAMQDLRYPIGPITFKDKLTGDDRRMLIDHIAQAPAQIRAAVEGLNEEQLDTPYREGGWTVRQVVHHLADSHANAYIRFRLAMTEDNPTIKPYDQAVWADMEDARMAPVETSLAILDGLHDRWVRLLRSLKEAEFARTAHHPEEGDIDIKWLLQMYSWHGRHHTAHITGLRNRKGW